MYGVYGGWTSIVRTPLKMFPPHAIWGLLIEALMPYGTGLTSSQWSSEQFYRMLRFWDRPNPALTWAGKPKPYSRGTLAKQSLNFLCVYSQRLGNIKTATENRPPSVCDCLSISDYWSAIACRRDDWLGCSRQWCQNSRSARNPIVWWMYHSGAKSVKHSSAVVLSPIFCSLWPLFTSFFFDIEINLQGPTSVRKCSSQNSYINNMIAHRMKPNCVFLREFKNNPVLLINTECQETFQTTTQLMSMQARVERIFPKHVLLFNGSSFRLARETLIFSREFRRIINLHVLDYPRSFSEPRSLPFPRWSSFRLSSSSSASFPSSHSRTSIRKNSLLVEKRPFLILFSTSLAISRGSEILMIFRIKLSVTNYVTIIVSLVYTFVNGAW